MEFASPITIKLQSWKPSTWWRQQQQAEQQKADKQHAVALSEEAQSERMYAQWWSNELNAVEGKQSRHEARDTLQRTQEHERETVMPALYTRPTRSTELAVALMNETQQVRQCGPTITKREDVEHLNAIMDQEADRRVIAAQPMIMIKNPSVRHIFAQQQTAAVELMAAQMRQDAACRTQRVESAIAVLNAQQTAMCEAHLSCSVIRDVNAAQVASEQETERRWQTLRADLACDAAVRARNMQFVALMMREHDIRAQSLEKQHRINREADRMRRAINVRTCTREQQREQQWRAERQNWSPERFFMIDHAELEYMEAIAVINLQNECIDFTLHVAAKCEALLSEHRQTRLLKAWQQRKQRTSRRRKRPQLDWILFADCRNVLNRRRARMLRQIKQRHNLIRLIRKPRSQAPTDAPAVDVLVRRSTSTTSTESFFVLAKAQPRKQAQALHSQSSYSAPTYTFNSKLKKRHIRNPLHRRLFRAETVKIIRKCSEPQSESLSPQKLKARTALAPALTADEKLAPMRVDTDVPSPMAHEAGLLSSQAQSGFDLTEYISPINEYLQQTNQAVDRCEHAILDENDFAANASALNATVQEPPRPTCRIFERLSKPKQRTVTPETETAMISKLSAKPAMAKAKAEVFDKLFRDAKARTTRKRVARSMYDSAVAATIEETCSFAPQLRAVTKIATDAAPVNVRLKKWSAQKERNLQKLIDNDPNRKHCTFTPKMSHANAAVFDYRAPEHVPLLLRLAADGSTEN